MMDMPISEAGYTGLAVGAAATGMRPIVELQFGDWVTIACDQLVSQAANMRYMFGGKLSIPMVMRLPCGAFGSAAAQHSHMWDSWFAYVPGLKVIAPSCPYDAKGLIKSAIRDNNPVLVFEHRICYSQTQELPDEEYLVEIGKADIKRVGEDVSIITHSHMVNIALEAAKVLQAEGISAEIVDLRSIKPMDNETIFNSVKKTNKAVCLQESWLTCSVASEVAARIAENCFDYLDKPIMRIGAMECPMPFAPDLEKYVLPDVDKIVEKVKKLVKS
jgi:pyruvate dehydrogenase E1 component beta subunit